MPPKKTKKWLWILSALLALGVSGAVLLFPREPQAPAAVAAPVDETTLGVGARGRIEPEDGILLVAAPTLSGETAIIADLRVKEGEAIQAGQVIAVLDARRSLERTLQQNEADVEVARRKLAQVRAGAKPADLDAQRIEVTRWESELEIATADHARYQRLRETGDVSAAELDQKRLLVERNRRALEVARERLKSLEEIRQQDIDVAEAEVEAAMAKIGHTRAELERTIIRSPAAGTVLKINAHTGEQVGADGILELGKTSRMFVVAEVYETDIDRVRVGQKATISGSLLSEKIEGTVSEIGAQVMRSELMPTDVVSFSDGRIIKVKVEVDDPQRVAGLIYGRVDVVIHP